MVCSLNELSENVSFDSEFALAFETQNRLKLRFLFFFLNANFSNYPRAEWVKEKYFSWDVELTDRT